MLLHILRMLSSMKVYVSGPITGLPLDVAEERFRSACSHVEFFGHESVCPWDNGVPVEASWQEHLGADIAMLLGCDAIYLMDGFHTSKGAQLELVVAKHQCMKVFVSDSIPPELRPAGSVFLSFSEV